MDPDGFFRILRIRFFPLAYTHEKIRRLIYSEKRLSNEKSVDTHDQPVYQPFFQPKILKGIVHVTN